MTEFRIPDAIEALMAQHYIEALKGREVLYVWDDYLGSFPPAPIIGVLETIVERHRGGHKLHADFLSRRLQAAADALDRRPSKLWTEPLP